MLELDAMNTLTAFGLLSVTAMLLFYALEDRSLRNPASSGR